MHVATDEPTDAVYWNVLIWFNVFQAAGGHDECVESLLQQSANGCVQDLAGRTPLHFAVMSGHVRSVGSFLMVYQFQLHRVIYQL